MFVSDVVTLLIDTGIGGVVHDFKTIINNIKTAGIEKTLADEVVKALLQLGTVSQSIQLAHEF